jgi:hypothetical protein
MRVASYVGLLATVIVGIGAFMWADDWWVTVLLILLALAIAWFSVGLFAKASTAAAYRALRGVASDSDIEELDHLDDRALGEAMSRASEAPDTQRDMLFQRFIAQVGGQHAARELVVEHMERHGRLLDEGAADRVLDIWRRYGIVRNQSLGDFLDQQALSEGP